MSKTVQLKCKLVATTTEKISVDFTKTFWIEKSQIKGAIPIRPQDPEIILLIDKDLAVEKVFDKPTMNFSSKEKE